MRSLRRAFVAAAVFIPLAVTTNAASAPLPSPWQLDRINQRTLPFDSNVSMGALTGAGIDIYIVDSGVLASHEQFGGRVLPGIDIPTDLGDSVVSPATTDCDGHGTHVSALAAGSTVGVATGARIIAVRVLDCDGGGNVEDVVTALKWIRGHHPAHQNVEPVLADVACGRRDLLPQRHPRQFDDDHRHGLAHAQASRPG